MAPRKKPQPRVEVDDAGFIKLLFEHNENRSAVARALGITHSAVSQRAKKLSAQIEQARAAGDGGIAAALVAQVVPQFREPTTGDRAAAYAFKESLAEAGRQYTIFDHMEILFGEVQALLDDVKKDINANREKGRSLKPYHIDQMVKLVREQRSIMTDAHKIRLELCQQKHLEALGRATVKIMLQYDPQVREKLYDELSQLDLAGQLALIAS